MYKIATTALRNITLVSHLLKGYRKKRKKIMYVKSTSTVPQSQAAAP